MACNYCNRPFSSFWLEKICPSCGFSFCVQCVEHTIFVKTLKTEKKVCVKCKEYNPSGEVHMIPPPEYYRKEKYMVRECQNYNINGTNAEDKETRQNGRNANVSNENYAEDEDSPSTSSGIRDGPDFMRTVELCRAQESDDDDSSDDCEDCPITIVKIGNKFKYCLRSTLQAYSRHRRQDIERLPSTKILRDAITELKDSMQSKTDMNKTDRTEAISNMPRPCILCPTTATILCKGCNYEFCMKCFDIHSDNVCSESLSGNEAQ